MNFAMGPNGPIAILADIFAVEMTAKQREQRTRCCDSETTGGLDSVLAKPMERLTATTPDRNG